MFAFDFSKICEVYKTLDIAKRNVLTILAMSYDPTRLLQPSLTNLKRFLKEICKHKFSWNEIVSEDFRNEFEKIMLSLQEIEKISVPINILPETYRQIKLELYAKIPCMCLSKAGCLIVFPTST